MTQIIVGKWGKNLAIRVPHELEQALGLSLGEEVEIESQDGDIIIRRSAANARAREDAMKAVAQIIANRKRFSLDRESIRELRKEGQRE